MQTRTRGIFRFDPRLLAAAALAIPLANAFGQFDLYSNGSANPANPGLATGATTTNGVAAPGGSQWSELQLQAGAANAIAGFSAHELDGGSAFRFADNFVVPAGSGWRVTTLRFYAYRADLPANQSPVNEVNFRVWSGQPGQPGSSILFGDDQTNRLSAAAFASVYRAFNTSLAPVTTPMPTRPIWRIDAAANVRLSPGTYWVDWQFVSSLAGEPVFVPPVVVSGARAKPGSNALQLKNAKVGTLWVSATDPGRPASVADEVQDLAFIIRGTCSADFNADGQSDFFDYLDFVAAFAEEQPAADFNGDGTVDFFDYLDFAAAFAVGC
jgi:hypothetical protein